MKTTPLRTLAATALVNSLTTHALVLALFQTLLKEKKLSLTEIEAVLNRAAAALGKETRANVGKVVGASEALENVKDLAEAFGIKLRTVH